MRPRRRLPRTPAAVCIDLAENVTLITIPSRDTARGLFFCLFMRTGSRCNFPNRVPHISKSSARMAKITVAEGYGIRLRLRKTALYLRPDPLRILRRNVLRPVVRIVNISRRNCARKRSANKHAETRFFDAFRRRIIFCSVVGLNRLQQLCFGLGGRHSVIEYPAVVERPELAGKSACFGRCRSFAYLVNAGV